MIRIRIQGFSGFGSGLRFLAGSGFDEYGSETLGYRQVHMCLPQCVVHYWSCLTVVLKLRLIYFVFFFSNEEQTALFNKKIQLLTDKYLDEFF